MNNANHKEPESGNLATPYDEQLLVVRGLKLDTMDDTQEAKE